MRPSLGTPMSARELRRRAEREAKRKSTAQPGRGHINLPITIRFNAQDEQDLQRKPHQMLKGFRTGEADEGDWQAITLRLNWGKVLSVAHFPDSVPQAEAGLEAIRSIKARHERTGKWGISQPEYEAIDWALAHMDGMQQMCTRRELRDAMEAVYTANEYLRAVGEIEERLDRAGS